MGITIDNTCEPKHMSKEEIVENLKTMGFGKQAFERFNAKERETLNEAWNIIDQYENCLKADMVDMLTEIQTEIEGQCKIPNNCASAYDWNNGVYACYKVIQQKINSLKSEE